MKEEGQIKGSCGAVVSLVLGTWLNLSPVLWLWAWDIGQPVLPWRLLEVGSGQLWGRRGVSEVWQDLSRLFLNRFTAAVDKLKDDDA